MNILTGVRFFLTADPLVASLLILFVLLALSGVYWAYRDLKREQQHRIRNRQRELEACLKLSSPSLDVSHKTPWKSNRRAS